MSARRILAYAAIYLLWGGTYLAVRTVVLVLPPFSAAGLRFLVSGLLLLVIGRTFGAEKHSPWPTRQQWWNSAKLGFVMFAINYACFFWAEQRLYSGLAAVIVATLPVWIFLIEWLIVRTHRPSLGSFAGTALGIAGVISLARNGTPPPGNYSHANIAIWVLLAGTICWAAGSVWSRSLQLPAQQMTRAALQMATGGVFLCVLALLAGEAGSFLHSLARWTPALSFWSVYLIFASIAAFTAYVWLLHHEPAARVASYAYVNPLVAIALGAGTANERFGRSELLGAALILCGTIATLRSPHPTVKKAA